MRSRPAFFLCLALLTPPARAGTGCDHALSPVKADWVWTYGWRDEAGRSSTFEQRLVPTAQGFAALTQGASGRESRSEYRCTAGAHVSLTVPSIAEAQITRAEVSGVSLPAAPGWKVGQRWNLTWNLEGKKGLLRGQGTVDTQYEVLSREKVTVPAGTFDAWKVRASTRLHGKVAGISLNQPAFTGILWYAEGVGLVRQQYPRSRVMELLALKK